MHAWFVLAALQSHPNNNYPDDTWYMKYQQTVVSSIKNKLCMTFFWGGGVGDKIGQYIDLINGQVDRVTM